MWTRRIFVPSLLGNNPSQQVFRPTKPGIPIFICEPLNVQGSRQPGEKSPSLPTAVRRRSPRTALDEIGTTRPTVRRFPKRDFAGASADSLQRNGRFTSSYPTPPLPSGPQLLRVRAPSASAETRQRHKPAPMILPWRICHYRITHGSSLGARPDAVQALRRADRSSVSASPYGPSTPGTSGGAQSELATGPHGSFPLSRIPPVQCEWPCRASV